MQLILPVKFKRARTRDKAEELIAILINQFSIFLFTSIFILFHNKNVFVSITALMLSLVPMLIRIKILLKRD